MLKLSKNKKFLQDLKNYKYALSCVSDAKSKIQYDKILQDFINNAKIIDNNHDSSYNGSFDTRNVKNIVIEMIDQRKILNKLYKDVLNS